MTRQTDGNRATEHFQKGIQTHDLGIPIMVREEPLFRRFESPDILSRKSEKECVGIPTFIDAAHAKAHDKVMIVDGSTAMSGPAGRKRQTLNFRANELNQEDINHFTGPTIPECLDLISGIK